MKTDRNETAVASIVSELKNQKQKDSLSQSEEFKKERNRSLLQI